MYDPIEIVKGHFKRQFDSWAGMYLGLPPDHEFTSSDYRDLGRRTATMLNNLIDTDSLNQKLLQGMPDDKLDEMYAGLNKRLQQCRKEIARRHGG